MYTFLKFFFIAQVGKSKFLFSDTIFFSSHREHPVSNGLKMQYYLKDLSTYPMGYSMSQFIQ